MAKTAYVKGSPRHIIYQDNVRRLFCGLTPDQVDLSLIDSRRLASAPQWQQLLCLRYEEFLSLREVGELFKKSPERIRQIERKAIRFFTGAAQRMTGQPYRPQWSFDLHKPYKED
jgi:hypothetical protein